MHHFGDCFLFPPPEGERWVRVDHGSIYCFSKLVHRIWIKGEREIFSMILWGQSVPPLSGERGGE